jgi:hypothetical protein
MSRTVRPFPALVRSCAAGAAALVLLTACGADGGSTAAGPRTPGSADVGRTPAPVAPAPADFCRQAAGIDARVDAALADLDDGAPSLPEVFSRIAVELRRTTAPAPIEADWTAVAAGLDRMAGALADLDLTDLHALEAAEGDLTTAGGRVDAYLAAACGQRSAAPAG